MPQIRLVMKTCLNDKKERDYNGEELNFLQVREISGATY